MYEVLKSFNRIDKGKHLRHIEGTAIELSKRVADACIKQGFVKKIKQTKQAKETTEGTIETK